MPRYTLMQMLMGIALLAIIFAFTKSEGCGRRYTVVECLSFSSNGKEIGVSMLNCRDARTPLKFYKRDLARTLSVIPSSIGTPARLVHKDVTRGNHGPAFNWWFPGRCSAMLNPLDDSCIAHEFGGGYVARYDRETYAEQILIDPQYPSLNIAISKSGRLVAAGWLQPRWSAVVSGINRTRWYQDCC